MEGLKFTPGRILFAFFSTIALIGIMAYLRLSFQQADVNTSIHLVEQVTLSGVTLQERMNQFISQHHRLCQAKVLKEFYGHMEVTCKDMAHPEHILIWQVNLSDGMVKPANREAELLGKGEKPWQK